MNRTDILKKCVDRGVAGETEVGAVSHLFYVYLLSALQRGQRVEIPRFGTFGTRVAGVKKVRKIPYFEPEQDLARKVNERFENLKYLVTGRYEPIGVTGDTEYRGRDVPYDILAEQGKETVIDTTHEVSLDEFQASAAGSAQQLQEENVMPRLNLKDEGGMGMDQEPLDSEKPVAPPPTLRDMGPSSGHVSPLLVALIALIVIGLGVFALNYFHVVHLWGKKVPKVTVADAFTEPAADSTLGQVAAGAGTASQPTGQQPAVTGTTTPAQEPTPLPNTPAETPKKKPAATVPEKPAVRSSATAPSSGTGAYTIQVSSWFSRGKAEKEAGKLAQAGFDAYVVDVDLSGETWHRVRVGRFGSAGEAKETLTRLQGSTDTPPFVAKISGK